MAVTRRAIQSSTDSEGTCIHRAKFSAITPKAIQDAFHKLEKPDPELSRSVGKYLVYCVMYKYCFSVQYDIFIFNCLFYLS